MLLVQMELRVQRRAISTADVEWMIRVPRPRQSELPAMPG